jgi:hypothetical protein
MDYITDTNFQKYRANNLPYLHLRIVFMILSPQILLPHVAQARLHDCQLRERLHRAPRVRQERVLAVCARPDRSSQWGKGKQRSAQDAQAQETNRAGKRQSAGRTRGFKCFGSLGQESA